MSITYTPSTNFGAKDSLPTNDPAKVIKGSEFTTEFTAIQTAFGLAAPAASPTFTGTVTIASVDINGGTIDGVTIGGSSAGAGSFTTLTASGDVNFDSGTLFVDVSANNVGIGTTSPAKKLDIRTSSAGEAALALISNDDATGTSGSPTVASLEFASSGVAKASIAAAVYGNDWLSFRTGSNTERMRLTTTGLGIGTSSPSDALDVVGNGKFTGNSVSVNNTTSYALVTPTNTGGYLRVGRDTSTGVLYGEPYANVVVGSGAYPMLFGTNNTERMRIDSSGRVGVGTPNPASIFEISSSNSTVWDTSWTGVDAYTPKAHEVEISNQVDNTTGSFAGLFFKAGETSFESGINAARIAAIRESAIDTSLAFSTRESSGMYERLRIDSSGNVGIGTSSPAAKLDVAGDTSVSGRHLTAQGASTTGYQFIGDGDSGMFQQASNQLQFSTAGSERMRIDSSGNLLVGKTSVDAGLEGHELRNGDFAAHTVDGGVVLNLRRLTSDGDIARFQKDGTTVGSIGTASGKPIFGIGDAYLFFDNGNNRIYNCDSSGADVDNNTDLGYSSARWDDIYATNGTIQTSDRNEKQDIAELDEAERRVAVAAKGLLRKFRWISSVEEKGDEARIHFGIIAQDLQAAFEAEGLDAGRYAMFTHTTWTDEETGEERSRMGVRYSELLAFIIAAL